jgi:hypothetical protein
MDRGINQAAPTHPADMRLSAWKNSLLTGGRRLLAGGSRLLAATILHLLPAILLLPGGCATGPRVSFVEGNHRIDVTADGTPFTSYLFGPELTKPILFPLLSPSGTAVNRGFPIEPAEGESRDHPHHAGLFFTYDRVNGTGFWNNTTAPPRVRHTGVTALEGGGEKGTLSSTSCWEGKEGKILLHEARTMVFRPGREATTIDFTIKLTADDGEVVFDDTKEGMFALRVASWLKEKGGTGRYLSCNGDESSKNVWGKRARWVLLEGEKDGLPIGVAILNHPESENFPTYWHARGYGLFAANPLGQSVFEKAQNKDDANPYQLTLEPGESALFRFRVIVYEGRWTAKQLDRIFEEYSRS